MSKAKVEFKFYNKGFDELRKSSGVEADLRRRGAQVLAAAGPGHDFIVHVGAHRTRLVVFPTTWEARHVEAKTRNLTQAFNAARG